MRNKENMGATLIIGGDSDIASTLIDRMKGIVVAHYYNSKEKVEEKNTDSREILTVFGDLSSISGITDFIAEVVNTNIRISRIVHLPASPPIPKRLTKIEIMDLQRELNIQVISAMMILKEFLPNMVKQHYGRVAIILTSYCMGTPPKYLAEYVVSKYALMGLMKSLAAEYAGKGVTINAVAPSMIETGFLSTLPDFEIEASAKANPMGRNARPEDIISVIEFLLSDAVEYMTGAIIPITGGSSMF
jgi:3-oxoacyl-[acyl-carrier protein] reductase